ncbi:fatty acid desaturase 4, chloroplastic-like [Typha latifolia]|uniref:fatty acid desaturase 4, chloroplastic-like n=1 Tax=Typha latifolia TaxID=4733 RepID=UPI003C2C4358
MYTLPPHCHLLRLSCRAVSTTRRPSHAAASPAAPSSLRSTWQHRAWVAAGSAAVLSSLSNSLSIAADTGSFLEPLLAAYLGYLVADLATGVYHWAIDNYGDASTPVFGSQIEAFQGHHKYPSTITKRQFANNLHALARVAAFVVPAADALAGGHAGAHAFVGTCAGCVVLSQQFHAWAHEKRGRLPAAVAAMQEARVLVSRTEHAAHHREPYDGNYCIVSGAWNRVLDERKVFEAMEMVVFFKFGLRPRSWSDTAAEWREEKGGNLTGEYI